jgi:uncharacterized membrane protein YvbJ
MFCSKCGKEISDGSVFCSHCGSKISGYSSESDKQESKTVNGKKIVQK